MRKEKIFKLTARDKQAQLDDNFAIKVTHRAKSDLNKFFFYQCFEDQIQLTLSLFISYLESDSLKIFLICYTYPVNFTFTSSPVCNLFMIAMASCMFCS